MPGANAAPPPAAGSRAVAEQLELLFEEPLTAPGRAAAAPTEQPKNRRIGQNAPISADRSEKHRSLRRSDGSSAAKWYPTPPGIRRARWDRHPGAVPGGGAAGLLRHAAASRP